MWKPRGITPTTEGEPDRWRGGHHRGQQVKPTARNRPVTIHRSVLHRNDGTSRPGQASRGSPDRVRGLRHGQRRGARNPDSSQCHRVRRTERGCPPPRPRVRGPPISRARPVGETTPILLLHSRTHPFSTNFVAHLADLLSVTSVREINGAGHMGPLLTPEAVATELAPFFAAARARTSRT